MFDFRLGDRVRCISPEADSEEVFGDTGTIWAIGDETSLDDKNLRVGVEWDNYSDGHDIDINNPCRENHGWWVYARTLQPIGPELPEIDIDFSTMEDIL